MNAALLMGLLLVISLLGYDPGSYPQERGMSELEQRKRWGQAYGHCPQCIEQIYARHQRSDRRWELVAQAFWSLLLGSMIVGLVLVVRSW